MPLWNQHLQVDIWVWFERMQYWFTHHSFVGLEGSEFLPATLLYLFIPTFLIPFGWFSYANYLPAALLVNLSVVAAHLILVRRAVSVKQFARFIFLLACFGPILLFRFDALATLTLILGLLFFLRQKYGPAGLFLGLSAAVKVYPIIFLPYLILILWQKRAGKAIATLLIYFFEAIILSVLAFFILGGDYQQILAALNFHNLKSISIESVPGSFLTGWSLLTAGQAPRLISGYGIWAIPGPAALFNRLWVLPVTLIYFSLWRRRLFKQFSWGVVLSLMLVFLVFSKNLNPQYAWWFMSLLPFVKPGRLIWLLSFAVAILNQLVYPIWYTRLLEEFYQHNQSYWLYFLLLLRNLLIICLAYLSLKIWYSPRSKTTGKLALK